MCRHAAYIGPGVRLTELMREMDHSLEHQAYAPRELLTGVVCADGFGVAWYDPDTRPEPGRYASILPIWNDQNLPSFGPLVRSGLVMGAVRNATVTATLHEANCAPFASGRHTLSLNGYLEDFDEAWRDRLVADWIAPARRKLVRGSTDGEHLLQALLTRLDDAPDGRGALASATQSLLRDTLAMASELGCAAHLDLLVADGRQVVATRAGNAARQNSLYHLEDGEEFPGGHVVASEPLYDDPAWQPVAESSLLVLQDGAPAVRMQV